ncbi:MarR family transcriptional regulator [Alicyclobacillus mali]|uniref:MarR family transcriptional regulator n=1 Tax=Alicyclobacillus mali (ex Roth et al. 2021) TaxID=1123961 RepID=A0ABS0F689_9BACL|nr:MarR family transcriptional regulator [Alicyclobacillus mali (ex Roth et al. 2021)]MCL6487791.1 MarR family transcriptional regulator [Alicyclobacillus mali (ex Roth et al. 2021)]
MNGDRLDIAQRLDTIMERFFRGMRSQFYTEDKFGLTHTQAFVLRHLSVVPQAKSSDLARIAGLSPGAITQVCDELVRLGYVERVRSSEDRRVVYVILTDRGRSHLRELTRDRAVKIAHLLDKLGEEDARVFLELLERLVTIMDEQPCGTSPRSRQEGET